MTFWLGRLYELNKEVWSRIKITRFHAIHNRFTCHWFDSIIFTFTICWKTVQELEWGATMGVIWSTTIYQGKRDCMFNENELLSRLGGFHQFMSFLGSIGSIMEGSGLRKALETVYHLYQLDTCLLRKAILVPIVVIFYQHLRYSRLCLKNSEMNLILMRKMIRKKIYKSDNPSVFEDDEISATLISWFIKRQKELSENSRISALWLYHARYIFIVQ